jgi:hypothetical protein
LNLINFGTINDGIHNIHGRTCLCVSEKANKKYEFGKRMRH